MPPTQHNAPADESFGENIQPNNQPADAQGPDDKRGDRAGHGAVMVKNQTDRRGQTKETERAHDQARNKDFRRDEEKARDKKGNDEGLAVEHGVSPA